MAMSEVGTSQCYILIYLWSRVERKLLQPLSDVSIVTKAHQNVHRQLAISLHRIFLSVPAIMLLWSATSLVLALNDVTRGESRPTFVLSNKSKCLSAHRPVNPNRQGLGQGRSGLFGTNL
jgi:hypothetical protein